MDEPVPYASKPQPKHAIPGCMHLEMCVQKGERTSLIFGQSNHPCLMIRENPSTHWPHEPDIPAILYPRGGIRVCLYAVSSTFLNNRICRHTPNHHLGSHKFQIFDQDLSRSASHQSRDQLADRILTRSRLFEYLTTH